MDRVISDARENVGQIGLRIDTVHPACFDDGVHAGRAFSTGVGTTEEKFFRPRTGPRIPLSAALLSKVIMQYGARSKTTIGRRFISSMHRGVFVTSNSARAHMSSQR